MAAFLVVMSAAWYIKDDSLTKAVIQKISGIILIGMVPAYFYDRRANQKQPALKVFSDKAGNVRSKSETVIKHSFTVKDLLLATFCIALALGFWMLFPNENWRWRLAASFPAIFLFGVALGAIYSKRPAAVGGLILAIYLTVVTVLLLISALVQYLVNGYVKP
jgi:hypothetical protein